jgi:hypothetical protein
MPATADRVVERRTLAKDRLFTVRLLADNNRTDRLIHHNVVVGMDNTVHMPNTGVKKKVRILFGMT